MNRVLFEAKGALHADRIARWLHSLPKPIGVMACSDVRGQQVLSACGQYGLTVPEEVAVVASGNDAMVCELGYPALSSVDTNTRELGMAAAAALERMIAGGFALLQITRYTVRTSVLCAVAHAPRRPHRTEGPQL